MEHMPEPMFDLDYTNSPALNWYKTVRRVQGPLLDDEEGKLVTQMRDYFHRLDDTSYCERLFIMEVEVYPPPRKMFRNYPVLQKWFTYAPIEEFWPNGLDYDEFFKKDVVSLRTVMQLCCHLKLTVNVTWALML